MLSINRCKKPIEQLTHFCGLYVTVMVDCGKIVFQQAPQYIQQYLTHYHFFQNQKPKISLTKNPNLLNNDDDDDDNEVGDHNDKRPGTWSPKLIQH